MSNFLSLPEEILLLAIEDKGGINPQSKNLDIVLAGSILMDLALRNRIDSDLEYLIPVSKEPAGDLVLDEALHNIFETKEKQSPAWWIARLGMRAEEFNEMLLSSLVVKRVLKVENQKVWWFFSARKYPLVGDVEVKEVRARIRDLVFSEALPDLRDMAVVSLVFYGNLLHLVFSEEDLASRKARIGQLAKMDLIGQAISKPLKELTLSAQIASKARSMLGIKTTQEKMDELVNGLKLKYHIKDDKDLPPWLRKGTEQYKKTLEFIEKSGTNDIYYHHLKGEYYIKNRNSVFSM